MSSYRKNTSDRMSQSALAKRDGAALVKFLASKKIEFTELGNARRLVALFGSDIRYCPQEKRWLLWNDFFWVRDDAGYLQRLAKRVIRVMHIQASDGASEGVSTALHDWALRSESAKQIGAMVQLASTEPGIPVAASEFDTDPMLLGVRNGVIDLSTGALRSAIREDNMTKQCSVEFDPNSACPTWETFIDRVTGGDKELARYLQVMAGYWLTGKTNEQCLFTICGPGANGKTVFLRVLQELMGDYARSTPPETLLVRRNPGGPSPDLARLHGVRLAFAYEPSEGAMLAEDVVKRITGQDKIICRNLYSNFFEYDPQFKFVLATNHKPIIRGDDHAIWRRIRLIPFEVIIPPKDQDKDLIAKLFGELPGILNWALDGHRIYQKERLRSPPCVVEATKVYRDEMDILADWIGDCLVEVDGERTSVADLYASYQTWCKASGHRPFGKKRLSLKLQLRGFESGRTGKGRYLVGLALRPTPDKASLLEQTVDGPMGTG